MIGRSGAIAAIFALAGAFACWSVLMPAPAGAGPTPREPLNYMLNCQGCHGPTGEGVQGKVPRMKGFTGFFLHTERGREFVIRVPGVSGSPLGDEPLTALMNWYLRTYSAEQLPEAFVPYAVDEVARLRRQRLEDPDAERAAVMRELGEQLPDVAAAARAASADYARSASAKSPH